MILCTLRFERIHSYPHCDRILTTQSNASALGRIEEKEEVHADHQALHTSVTSAIWISVRLPSLTLSEKTLDPISRSGWLDYDIFLGPVGSGNPC